MSQQHRELCISIFCQDAQTVYLQHVSPSIFIIRDKAINLIVGLVEAYHSKTEVLVHAVALIDRLISKSTFEMSYFSPNHRIVKFAVGCFMISVKLRDSQHPCVQDLALLTSCECDEIRAGEEEVLLTLKWNVELTTGLFTSCELIFCLL